MTVGRENTLRHMLESAQGKKSVLGVTAALASQVRPDILDTKPINLPSHNLYTSNPETREAKSMHCRARASSKYQTSALKLAH